MNQPALPRTRTAMCFGTINDRDIIDYFIQYHLSIGVDAFVAVDLGSNDGTAAVLEKYESMGVLHLTRLPTPEACDEYNGAASVATAMTVFGAEWCLFADPDEFWVLPCDVATYLESVPGSIVSVPRYNMLPSTSRDGAVEHFTNFSLVVRRPFEFSYDLALSDYDVNAPADSHTLHRLLLQHPPEVLRGVIAKTAARARAIDAVMPGAHDVTPNDPATSRFQEKRAYIAHFPFRSPDQFKRKAMLVYDCIERNPPMYPDVAVGVHWARLNALYWHDLVDAEFERQLLSESVIADYLRRGVLEHDATISRRLRALSVAHTE